MYGEFTFERRKDVSIDNAPAVREEHALHGDTLQRIAGARAASFHHYEQRSLQTHVKSNEGNDRDI